MKKFIFLFFLFSTTLYSQTQDIEVEIVSESEASAVLELPVLDFQDRILGVHSNLGWELYYSEGSFEVGSKFMINSLDAISGNFKSKRIAILHKEPLGRISPDHSPNEYYLSVFNFESELIFTTKKHVCIGILPELVVHNDGSVSIIGGNNEKEACIIKKFSPIGDELWSSIIPAIGLYSNVGLSANQKYVWAFNSKLRYDPNRAVNSFIQVLSASNGELLLELHNKENVEKIIWKEDEEVIFYTNELIEFFRFSDNEFEKIQNRTEHVRWKNEGTRGIWNFQDDNFIARVGNEKYLCSSKEKSQNLREIFSKLGKHKIYWAYIDAKGFARIKTEKSNFVFKLE